MTSVQSSREFISLQNYSTELQAENLAKSKQIEVLSDYIKTLEHQNLSSPSISHVSNCEKCKEKDRKILQTERNIKLLNELKNKQKDYYQKKIKEYLEKINLQSTYKEPSIIKTHSVRETIDTNQELEQVKKSNIFLKTQIQSLKNEKERKISELQKNLRDKKSQLQRQKEDYDYKLKLANSLTTNRTVDVSNQQTNNYKKQIESLSKEIGQLKIKNEELTSRYDEHVLRKSKQWTNLRIDEHNEHNEHRSSKSHQKLRKYIDQSDKKNQFMEKRLFEVEQWNRILRQQILMKMPNHHREVCVEPLRPQINRQLTNHYSSFAHRHPQVRYQISPAKLNIANTYTNKNMNITYGNQGNILSPRYINQQPHLNSQYTSGSGFLNQNDLQSGRQTSNLYNRQNNQDEDDRKNGKIFKYQGHPSDSSRGYDQDHEQILQQNRLSTELPTHITKVEQKSTTSAVAGFLSTLFRSEKKTEQQGSK